MFLPMNDLDVSKKNVLVRLDLDLPKEHGSFDETRLKNGLPTLRYLLKKKAENITIIAHRGRPQGKKVSKLSLAPVEKLLRLNFSPDENKRIIVLENLRFNSGEEKNSQTFTKSLTKEQDYFVFDAFADAHRNHASVIGISKILPTALGLQFQKDMKGLEPIIKDPKRPYVILFGGAKAETKLPYLEKLKEKADVLLVGGKLAIELGNNPVTNRRLIVGQLTDDGRDLSFSAIEQFLRFIAMAKTIVWNGPVGLFEDPVYMEGTKVLANAIARSKAYTVAGGGDTEAALTQLKLTKHFSFISSGGGAMLYYLANGTLPVLESRA